MALIRSYSIKWDQYVFNTKLLSFWVLRFRLVVFCTKLSLEQLAVSSESSLEYPKSLNSNCKGEIRTEACSPLLVVCTWDENTPFYVKRYYTKQQKNRNQKKNFLCARGQYWIYSLVMICWHNFDRYAITTATYYFSVSPEPRAF